MLIRVHGNPSFFSLITKSCSSGFPEQANVWKVALCAAELTRMAVFVIRTLSYWFLNYDELDCAYLFLLVLWELRMYLLSKGTELCS